MGVLSAKIREVSETDRDWAAALVAQYFGSPEIISRGVRHDTRLLAGLIAEDEGNRLGLLHYRFEGEGCEIVALVVLNPRLGIGRRMVDELMSLARRHGCRRVWLATTNDNRVAQRFYEAMGWRLVAVHRGAVTSARRLKPEIPTHAADGTPIEDELEYERRLDAAEPGGTPKGGSVRSASSGKRLRIIFAVLLVAVLGGLVWTISHSGRSEPMVDGSPLSSWLNYYVSARSEAQRQMADQALDKVGTNAIPTLVRMLRRTDSPFKRKVMELSQKQHFIPIRYIPAERQNQAAYFAFLKLGHRASAAVPALIEIYERRVSPFSRQCAAQSLGAIGPAANAAVPVLIRGMADTNTLVRCDTLLALSHLQPDLVTPVLTNALSDHDAKVRHFACQALWLLGGRLDTAKARSPDDVWVKQAVTALGKSLRDPDPGVRTYAAMALRQFDPEAAAKAGAP